MLIVGGAALVGALVSGLLGFIVYPRKSGSRKKRQPSPQQGFARAMFIIFAACAFVALFFGLLIP